MPSNVVVRGERFGARCIVNGRGMWLGTFDTEAAAQAAVASVLGGRSPAGTVAEWFDGWALLAAARRSRSADTISRTRKLAQGFVERFGSWKLASVSRGEAAAWAMQHPGTARYARTILQDAVWAGRLDVSPLEGVRLPGAGSPAVRLGEDEIRRLVGNLGSDMSALVLICAYSGLRLSEALALETRDLDGDVLHVRCGKGGKEGHAILFEPGRNTFLQHAPMVGRLFAPSWDRFRVNKRWRAACDVAGVRARFHDLRHFHATWLLERGVAREDVAAQLRHAGLRDVDRYLATRTTSAALERVRGVA